MRVDVHAPRPLGIVSAHLKSSFFAFFASFALPLVATASTSPSRRRFEPSPVAFVGLFSFPLRALADAAPPRLVRSIKGAIFPDAFPPRAAVAARRVTRGDGIFPQTRHAKPFEQPSRLRPRPRAPASALATDDAPMDDATFTRPATTTRTTTRPRARDCRGRAVRSKSRPRARTSGRTVTRARARARDARDARSRPRARARL